jgi:hypothetical protein
VDFTVVTWASAPKLGNHRRPTRGPEGSIKPRGPFGNPPEPGKEWAWLQNGGLVMHQPQNPAAKEWFKKHGFIASSATAAQAAADERDALLELRTLLAPNQRAGLSEKTRRVLEALASEVVTAGWPTAPPAAPLAGPLVALPVAPPKRTAAARRPSEAQASGGDGDAAAPPAKPKRVSRRKAPAPPAAIEMADAAAPRAKAKRTSLRTALAAAAPAMAAEAATPPEALGGARAGLDDAPVVAQTEQAQQRQQAADAAAAALAAAAAADKEGGPPVMVASASAENGVEKPQQQDEAQESGGAAVREEGPHGVAV